MTSRSIPSPEELVAFLEAWHRDRVTNVAPLRGGFWSTAFGYEVDGSEFVVRLSESSEAFEMDRAARVFSGPDMPIPEVLDVGTAFDRSYAISRRARGRFLEDITTTDADAAGPAIDLLLDRLRTAGGEPSDPVDWYPLHAGGAESWQTWLRDRLVDDPKSATHGWRSTVESDPVLARLLRRTEGRILDLIDVCPERRDLVHGDLLHQNVLVSDDARAINAVFSWKCSVRGDHLYDVAWLTFWGPWHPGVDAVDAWARTTSRRIAGDDFDDAADRHHCYELLIGAQHLAWCAWTGNGAALAGVALRTAHVLERGPRDL